MLRCHKCRWAERSTGLSADLLKFNETTKCSSCSGARTFKCPKCGNQAKLNRIKNSGETKS